MDIQTNWDVLTQIAEYSIKLQKEKPTMQYAGQEIVRKCHLAIIYPAFSGMSGWLKMMEDRYPSLITEAITLAAMEGYISGDENKIVHPGLLQEDVVIAILEPRQYFFDSPAFLSALDGSTIQKIYPDAKLEYMPQATIWVFLQPRQLPEALKRRMTVVTISDTHTNELMQIAPKQEVID